MINKVLYRDRDRDRDRDGDRDGDRDSFQFKLKAVARRLL
jgi:hypothetical protein